MNRNLSYVTTCLVLVAAVLVALLVGVTSAKKRKALSFQTGSDRLD